jgi:hypothetical protein
VGLGNVPSPFNFTPIDCCYPHVDVFALVLHFVVSLICSAALCHLHYNVKHKHDVFFCFILESFLFASLFCCRIRMCQISLTMFLCYNKTVYIDSHSCYTLLRTTQFLQEIICLIIIEAINSITCI